MKGNLHGVSAFKGGSPHHAFVTGKTGSGKSVHVNDLITQLDPFADELIVVDNGNSYGATLRVLSGGACRAFAPDVNGQDTLNYWDTGGLPLSPLHVSSVVNVLHLMAGHKSDQDADFLRGAVIARCVREFLEAWARRWIDDDGEREPGLRRELAELRRFAAETHLEGDLTEIHSAYAARNPKHGLGPAKNEEDAGDIADEDGQIAKLSFAQMSPKEMPTHSDFHDWLAQRAHQADRNRDELETLVTLLEIWRADLGIMGRLFDGVNTVDLGARYVHIELGRIQDADQKIRALVSFVLANKILGAIIRGPRSERKHVVLEELGALLGVEGGKQIVKDFYERARKYNCWVVSVIQQISTLPDDLARSVIGNCRQAFLFMQREPIDTALLQELFELPDSIVDILKNFKEPSAEHGSSFVHWEELGERIRITPAANLASPEMLYVGNSSADAFEDRERALAKYEDPVEGVIAEVARRANK